MNRRFDITLAFGSGVPAWPGEPRPVLSRISDMDEGKLCNVTRLDFAVHYGTHLDAPIHFIRDGADVASLSLDVLMGPCVVARVPDHVAEIGPAELDALAIPAGCERLLLRSRNSALWDRPNHPFFTDFTAFTPDGARWLVKRGLKLVGIDYLSVQRFTDREPTTHRVLLGAGIVAVEGLDLRGIESGDYDLVCLPLKLMGADGSPCRVVLTRNS
jgi:arylformamidase